MVMKILFDLHLCPLKKNQVLKIYLFCCTVPRFQLPRSRKKARAGPSPFIEALVRAHRNPREVSSEKLAPSMGCGGDYFLGIE